ncbi:lysophospholipid acyltransferase family protein [Pseudoflavonifractor phocaeensis]|uniref:lysophospholipid acyltransferase family protein n=1 Tax=Pseudoflavonifractor phocaeensis TaxID=1870988 RepID=UPI001F3C108B|nr:1-acyl-sn-glycerol-3-phosphate acyltransferase [Pseudoflavonifractor phocaeensis]MDY3905493.1 lysophospholipid acyltransferase family protein [Lawsonibacter sp.]
MSTELAAQEESRREDRRRDAWFHFLYAVIWPFFNLFRPLRVVGRENIPDGAAVLCPNHTTLGDPFYVVFAFGRKYPMRAMAKIQIMRVPVIGWILGKAGVFGVDRGRADMKAVKTALKFLKDGNKLLMFPEGTRVHEGEDVAAKTGAAMFATRTGAPLLPIYIQRKKKLFARNVVVIGQPYHPEYAGRKPTPDELDAIAGDLMDRVRKLGEGQE